eukprot:686639-Prymnesium_polylepis.1
MASIAKSKVNSDAAAPSSTRDANQWAAGSASASKGTGAIGLLEALVDGGVVTTSTTPENVATCLNPPRRSKTRGTWTDHVPSITK